MAMQKFASIADYDASRTPEALAALRREVMSRR